MTRPHAPPASQYPEQRSSRPSAPVLLGVILWRLLVAGFGIGGFAAAVADSSSFGSAVQALSQQASLLTGVVFLALAVFPLFTSGRAHEPSSPWVRGALTVLLLLVAITFQTLLGGDLTKPDSLFEHALTPLVVLIDFLAVGSNQARVKWWYPLTWVVPPTAYLIYFVIADVDLYGSFLNPGAASFPGTVTGFLLAVVAAGYVLYGAGKLRTRNSPQNAATTQHLLVQQPPPQQYTQHQP